MNPLPPFTSSELKDLNLTEEEYHVLDMIVTNDLIPHWRGVPSLLSAVEMLILNGLVAMPLDPESNAPPEVSEEGVSVSESFEALDYDQIRKVVYRIGAHQEYTGQSVAQALAGGPSRIQPGDLIRHVYTRGMIGICTDMGSAKLTFGINGDKTTIDVRDHWSLVSKSSSEVV
jgi:hypothetical protein